MLSAEQEYLARLLDALLTGDGVLVENYTRTTRTRLIVRMAHFNTVLRRAKKRTSRVVNSVALQKLCNAFLLVKLEAMEHGNT